MLATESLTLASDIGAGLVVFHGSQEPIDRGSRTLRGNSVQRSLEALVEAARICELKIALELLSPEWIPAGAEEAAAMLHGLDPDVIGFCLDTNHANLTGDLSDIIGQIGPRLLSVHLSDNDGIQQRHWMPFEGVIDFAAVISALRSAKYCGPLVYELDPRPEGFDAGLRHIRDNFDRLMTF